MDIQNILQYLKEYDGPPIKLMEVCGSHTSAIFKHGIRSLISSKIHLISGPGCPVCVTPSSYIDKCISYATRDNHVLLTFGDMMKVPGTSGSLSEYKGKGANIQLMYSPFEAITKAQENKNTTYVIAAVGFETTIPAYAMLLQEAIKYDISNIKLITGLRTMIPALTWICENQKDIDGFICPGHVSVIIGSKPYEDLAKKYEKPFVVAGFEPEHILAVIYDIVRQTEKKERQVRNLYQNVVKTEGNIKAQQVVKTYFETGEAMWRGLGVIPDSGLFLREEYMVYDGGSKGLHKDKDLPKECKCDSVIVGEINPNQCPLFGEKCVPMEPFGPCMVSPEGACGIWYRNVRMGAK